MNCRELRLYFEDPLRIDAKLDAEAEHLAHCAECTRFVEQQRELGAGLRLARMSAPTVPASLDEAVLRAYRRQSANRRPSASSAPRPQRLVVLCCSAAAAAIVLVAALLTFRGPRTDVTVAPTAPEPTATPPPIVVRVDTNKPRTVARQRPHATQPLTPAPTDLAVAASLPPGFRSLMYCDALSCSGPMDMIRVQLPIPATTVGMPVANPPGGAVFADVLVGSDGIARGIRIVE